MWLSDQTLQPTQTHPVSQAAGSGTKAGAWQQQEGAVLDSPGQTALPLAWLYTDPNLNIKYTNKNMIMNN